MSDTISSQQLDTFDMISYRALGDCRYTGAVLDANRGHLLRHLMMSAGNAIVIPDVEEPTLIEAAIRPWQRV